MAKIDQQINRLLEMRIDEEIDRKEYETRKADYTLQKSRLESQIQSKYRENDGYKETVINMLKILSKVKDIFSTSIRAMDKQLLLHILFKQIKLKEGKISCILNKPFSYILSDDTITGIGEERDTKHQSCELQQSQRLKADLGVFLGNLKNSLF